MSGRGASYPTPPPQIPPCSFPAVGSRRRSNAIEGRSLAAHVPSTRRLAASVTALRPAHSRGHHFVTRYPKASDISSPPCLLRLLPAGANRRVGLAPTGKRRLVTAHPHRGRRVELLRHRYEGRSPRIEDLRRRSRARAAARSSACSRHGPGSPGRAARRGCARRPRTTDPRWRSIFRTAILR